MHPPNPRTGDDVLHPVVDPVGQCGQETGNKNKSHELLFLDSSFISLNCFLLFIAIQSDIGATIPENIDFIRAYDT